jgi:MFS family permease
LECDENYFRRPGLSSYDTIANWKVTASPHAVSEPMPSNGGERWLILAVLFLARTAMGFQFQAVAALSLSVVTDFSIDYTQIGLLIGIYLFPGIMIAYPGGLLGQYFGDKRIAVFGMALMAVGGLLTATGNTPLFLPDALSAAVVPFCSTCC